MKVNIIGAGISGLSVGCYLQMNGYETEIYEKHSLPGDYVQAGNAANILSTVAFIGCLELIKEVLFTSSGRNCWI